MAMYGLVEERKTTAPTFRTRLECPHKPHHPVKSTTGSRPCQSHHFTGCSAHVTLNGSIDGSLKVTSLNLTHNHAVGPEYTRLYASERKLTPEEQVFIARQLEMKTPASSIAIALGNASGKFITTKQVNNKKQVSHLETNHLTSLLKLILIET